MDSLREHYIKKGIIKPAVENDGGENMEQIPLCLPLYGGLKDFIVMRDQTANNFANCPHPGLVFDKFPCHWSGNPKWKEKSLTSQEIKNLPDVIKKDPTWNPNQKTRFLKKVIELYYCNTDIDDQLESICNRLKSFRDKIKGKHLDFFTQWRFVTGLGMGHVLETGFVWHRTLGVPYLPASSVKGLIRAWVDPDKGWGTKDGWEKYNTLFGDSDDIGAGRLIVFDALPLKKPLLELDIMNPHYAPYYEDNNKPPADYYSPRPIFFIAVAPGTKFRFSIAPRTKDVPETEVDEGLNLLKEALGNLGAGAKTAVGYGYMEVIDHGGTI